MDPQGCSPVAVGTRGTIGALVKKEMEYFCRNECAKFGSKRSALHVAGMASVQTDVRVTFGFFSTNWLRKRLKSRLHCQPYKCSVMQVVEHCRHNKVHNAATESFVDELKNLA